MGLYICCWRVLLRLGLPRILTFLLFPSWAAFCEKCGGPNATFSVCGCGCLERKKVSGSGHLIGYKGSLQLLDSSHVRERDKALLRSIMVGGVWNGFLLGKVEGETVSCRVL